MSVEPTTAVETDAMGVVEQRGQAPRWATRRRPSGRAAVLACAAGLAAVFALPYALPVRPALSVSYCMGFSNRGCVAVLVLFLAWFGWWYGPVVPKRAEQAETPRALGTGTLGLGLLLMLVTQAVVWWYGLVFGPMQEALYLLDRLRHLAAGERVYRDFELIYGPGLVYLPLFISKVFAGAAARRLIQGYFAALTLGSLVGVVLLWAVVRTLARHMKVTAGRARTIFWLLFLTVWLWSWLFAEQYTPLRFWLTTAVALWALRLIFDRGRPWLGLLVLLGGTVLSLLLSPEQAFVLLGGTVVLAVVFLPWRSRLWWGVGMFALGGGGLLAVAARTEMFRTFHAMATGSYSMPVTPSAHAVLVVGLLAAGAAAAVEAVRRRSGPTRELYLLCLSVFLLPAAFGRFDLVHVLGNLMPALLVGLCVLARSERLWRYAGWGYVLGALLLPLPMMGYQVLLLVRNARAVRGGEAYSMALTHAAGLPRLYSPFGAVEEWKGERPQFVADAGSFYGLEDVIDARQVAQKVRELETHRQDTILVLPHGCIWEPGRKDTLLFTMGFYAKKATRKAYELAPICAAFERDFERVPGPVLPNGMTLARHR